MPTKQLTRIVRHPFAHLMQGARLDSFAENGNEIHMQVQGLEIVESELFERDGVVMERVTGRHVPLKLSFSNVQGLKRTDFFAALGQYPLDDPSRIVNIMHSWIMPGMEDIFHIFGMRGPLDATMNFFAASVTHEQAEAGPSFTFERDWSPSPPMPEREVPQPYDLYDRFGGDPVTFSINGNVIENRLFVGGLENQPEYRPEIDAVLNLGEKPSLWVKDGALHANDRAVEKGEGSKGMTVDEIRAEADWVINRLQENESVLIHCVAGMNRSPTVCCAVLMLLEGLSAEEALRRVYETHPWAKPDSHHWLMLRWLEKNNNRAGN
ncbi:dual specificity protein phosphatase family protein [Chloroflexi bacterium CFX6]|nr:dual specificity protein phosphatase family protein [Chloroflexi bacterium CFX6]